MTPEFLFTIHSKGENYAANIFKDTSRVLNGKPAYWWYGDCDNDVDGTSYWALDQYGQKDTSLHLEGKPIDGDSIPFIVVPPEIIKCTPEIVLGCVGTMEWKDQIVSCVVADTGPHSKIGEASPAALRAVGAPAYRNGNGGVDEQEVLFRIWPGVPAVLTVGGGRVIFDLQAS